MRKTSILGLGLATTLLAASCTNDENFNQELMEEGISFSSSISSRATDNSFEPYDKIGVSMKQEGVQYALYSTADGKNFTSKSPLTYGMAGDASTVDFIAVYPYQASSVNASTYSFTLSTEADTPLTNNDVMYGTAPGISVGAKKVNLNFKHKLVKVVVRLVDANGDAITGAQLEINNQQLTGQMDMTDGTVSPTDAADDTMPFAANASVRGEYQAIVMPSDPVQGRYIKITYNKKEYSIPVDGQKFAPGKKLSFPVTLNDNGTVEEGTPITVIPSVTDWEDEKIESGWLLTGEISVIGKSPKQLASNIELNSSATVINNFTGTLLEDDVWCITYTRSEGEASEAANITIAPATGGQTGKSYSLPAGQADGKLLVKVGENTTGISIATTETGITLTDVTVYTSSTDVVIPITLWEGEATPNTNWPNDICNFTIDDETAREALTLGAKLHIYYDTTNESDLSLIFDPYTNNNYGGAGPIICDKFNVENNENYVSVTILSPLLNAIEKNNYVVGITGTHKLFKILLVPASADDVVSENLLWKGKCEVLGTYTSVGLWLPENIVIGGKIRVNYTINAYNEKAAKLGGYLVTYPNGGPAVTETILQSIDIPTGSKDDASANVSYYDYEITSGLLTTLQNKIINKNRLLLYDENNAYGKYTITSIEYIPASEADTDLTE